jgi:RHS repeat-associated protein
MTEKKDRYDGGGARKPGGTDGGQLGGAGSPSARGSSEDAGPTGGPGSSRASQPRAETAGTGLLPAVSLPKGGGALHGIGEKFATNAATGTGALTVPIATSPGRGGVGPALQLAYDSGAGNGPFGLGWTLSVPSITRKTDKGLPRYHDGEDSDVFILSGAEDLVPVRVADGTSTRLDVTDRGDYRVQRFRPRVEGLFARIERWTQRATGDAYWRAITRDNAVSVYGQSAQARIADPEHPERVFTWLLEETRDDRGNVIRYRYKAEDAAGVDPGLASEANRFVRQPDGARRFAATAQRYLKRIQYGNRTPVARDQPAPVNDTDWLFEVVLDYGEHDAAAPTPAEAVAWPVRPDPFSRHRATFEVRTYRLCRRVLMFHRFAELGTAPCLVRSTDFSYADARVRTPDGAFDQGPVASYLASVIQAGYVRTGSGYERAAQPPLALGYTQPVVHDQLQVLSGDRASGVPDGPRGAGAQWVDLDGEGIPGALTATDRAWYYRANLGGGELGPAVVQRSVPAAVELGAGAQLSDLDGDGNLDLVNYAPSLAGFFARTAEHDWAPFAPLGQLPAIDWNDPNLRFLDLDGDGFPDVLITEDDAFVWYRSRAKDGFDPAVRTRQPHQELDGPVLVFADPTEAIQLADMTGDGLVDLVRVRNGEVCYWPNLGYGRFGRKVTLDHGPRFDTADRFTATRVRFADIDGSGTSDIVYLGTGGVAVYFNRSGNALSAALRVRSLPRIDGLSQLAIVDLLGQGTSCLVWTSSDPGVATPVAYVDLMGGQKPHLLASVVNNLGGETRIDHAPSTQFYLQDKAEGRPWLTRLAFPVHVIERVEHIDHVAGTSVVSRFRYHHGFFDGHEREFHGFARVEQWDAESFTGDLDLPPVRTVTWFHTGAWLERERLELAVAQEYYQGDSQAPLLPDTVIPSGLTVREEREAARAMRGQILRQEIYAEDGMPESVHPYSVSERSYQIRLLQHVAGMQHAVFFVHPGETIDLHYERRPDDPRTQHQVVLAVDDFGNVTQSAAIGYPRRVADEAEQGRLWIAVTDAAVANRASELDAYRVGVAISSQLGELTGLAAPSHGLITAGALSAAIAAATEIPFEVTASGTAMQRRTVKRQRTLYYRDDLSGPLALGAIESRALPYESYQQAFTPGLVTQVYGDRVTDGDLTGPGAYVLQDGVWWAPSGRVIPDPAQFYAPVEAIDPFGQHTQMRYDGYALLPVEIQDPLGNRTTVGLRDTTGAITQGGNDYRVLAPVLITDPNRNRSAIALDALGMVIETAVMGKDGAGEGDTLADPTTRLEYDLHAWQNTGQPVFVHTLAREQHGAGNPRWQESYCYSDGTGREVMTKVQAEPGPVPVLDGDGHIVRNPDGTPQTQVVTSRWVGTGRTVFDNKGNPVKKYEPFFSATFAYEDERELVEWGVTPIVRYDPLGRVIRTDFPDGTNARVVFDAWSAERWDQDDTVAGTPWLARMQAGSAADQRAASLALAHAGTPAVSKLDALGRMFLTIADNGTAGQYQTRTAFDIEGNALAVTDARGIATVAQTPDLLGRALRASSADAGESRELPDAAGKPALEWTARDHRRRRVFDALQRPTHLFVRPGAGTEQLAERTVYGEIHPDAENRNLRGVVHESYDGAGVAITARRDLDGNAIEVSRRLAADYHAAPDWTPLANLTVLSQIEAAAASLLDPETFTTTSAFDALGRVVSRTTPDASQAQPTYNAAGLLERLDVHIRGAGTGAAVTFVQNIDYNARGQRERIEHGNGTICEYEYDPQTFRLTRQRTTRTGDGKLLQDLRYEYDPVGNIVQVSDAVSYGNPDVSADGLYTYDAIYQLTTAQGREHPGQQPGAADADLLVLDHPNDLATLRRYQETYAYDAVGNLEQVSHQPLGTGPSGWTRVYHYATDSNRLLGTSLPGDAPGVFSAAYTYDAAGNMITMPHLAQLGWDHEQRFVLADRGGGGEVYFAYDASGQRVRKAYDHGGFVEERIYLDGYELYRNRNRTTGAVALERQTLHVRDAARVAVLVETKTIDTSIPGFTPTTRQRYQVANHLGSTAAELDASGGVITYEEYFPYGGTSWQATASTTDVSARRYRYTGKERDDETGLYYHGARYYAAWLGRWTSADPAGFVDGVNLYRYGRNNPIGFLDPDGRESKQQAWLREFRAQYPKLENIGRVVGTHDPGVLTENGIRVTLIKGNFLEPRKFYERKAAAFLAYQGYIHYAELVEAGQDAAAVHLALALKEKTGRDLPRDNELDLDHYVDWSTNARVAREGAQLALAAGEVGEMYGGMARAKPPVEPTPPPQGNATPPPGNAAAPAAATTTQLTTGQIGALGEREAVTYLQSNGYSNIRPIQNGSGHGIDLVAADRNGATEFFEVKSTTGSSAPSLSPDQRSMQGFVTSRLDRAASGAGAWRNVAPAVRADAAALRQQIRSGTLQVRGQVLEVTGVGTATPTVTPRTW